MYEKIILPNGLRIIYEPIPFVRSASLGVWVGAGSRHETAAMNGAAHFIEHMLFKGTKTRTAAELAQFMDRAGGQVNAFTTKECTCYHGRVVDTMLGDFAGVLGDMIINSNFAETDVESERGVIFEEIDMYNDTPEDLVTERLHQNMFKDSSLARPILGKRSTLSKMTGESLSSYLNEKYTGESVVVSLSGSFTDEDIKRISEIFSKLPSGKKNTSKQAVYNPCHLVKKKSIEQNHITIAFPGVSLHDRRRYPLQILSDIFGSGMSSRLFQKVREENGLCYSIYSYASSYTDCGVFSISTALSEESQEKALALIFEEIKNFLDTGVTEDELARSMDQIRASLLMALESTSARMNRLGRGELFYDTVLSPEEVLSRYEAVTAEDIIAVGRDLLRSEDMSISILGKVRGDGDNLDIPLW